MTDENNQKDGGQGDDSLESRIDDLARKVSHIPGMEAKIDADLSQMDTEADQLEREVDAADTELTATEATIAREAAKED